MHSERKPSKLLLSQDANATDEDIDRLALALHISAAGQFMNTSIRASARLFQAKTTTDRIDRLVHLMMAASFAGEFVQRRCDRGGEAQIQDVVKSMSSNDQALFKRIMAKPRDEQMKALMHIRGKHIGHHDLKLFQTYAVRIKNEDMEICLTEGEGSIADTHFVACLEALWDDSTLKLESIDSDMPLFIELTDLTMEISYFATTLAGKLLALVSGGLKRIDE